MKNLLLLFITLSTISINFAQKNEGDPPVEPPTNWTAAVLDGDTGDSCFLFCGAENILGELTFQYGYLLLNPPQGSTVQTSQDVLLNIQVKNLANQVIQIKDPDEQSWSSSVTSVPFVYDALAQGWVCDNSQFSSEYTIQSSGSIYIAYMDVDISVPNPDFHQLLYDCNAITPPFSYDCDDDPIPTARKSSPLTTQEVELMIYPNPVSDILNLSYSAPSSATSTMSISNMNGTIIWQGQLNAHQNSLAVQTESFAPGIYVMNVKNEIENKFQLFMKH